MTNTSLKAWTELSLVPVELHSATSKAVMVHHCLFCHLVRSRHYLLLHFWRMLQQELACLQFRIYVIAFKIKFLHLFYLKKETISWSKHVLFFLSLFQLVVNFWWSYLIAMELSWLAISVHPSFARLQWQTYLRKIRIFLYKPEKEFT